MTRTNSRGQKCDRCGAWCNVGDGVLTPPPAGERRWRCEHRQCPPPVAAVEPEPEPPPEPPGDPHVAAQWAAYHQIRGLVRAERPLTISQLADVLEGADMAAMDAEVAANTADLMRCGRDQ